MVEGTVLPGEILWWEAQGSLVGTLWGILGSERELGLLEIKSIKSNA